MEIVFAAGERENPKAPGDEVARKSSEGKTAENQSTAAFVSNPAELRALGESRIATPSPDVKNPLEEHLINQIREKLDAAGHGSDNGQITLKLHPDELGELKINMRIEDQHLKVEITTQNPSVKDALMQNLDTLKDTLSRQNISMDRFDVSADLRQGLHQGGRDGKQMTQDSRLINTGFQHTVDIEDDATPNSQYSWESENSLVNLVL
jgi:flagellar hook-length control protein FliK